LKDWAYWAIDDNNAKDYDERKKLLHNKLQQLEDIILFEMEQRLSTWMKECDNENHQTRQT
jgi:hypothetical protein